MIKRLAGTVLLAGALVMGTGAGVASAVPGHNNGHHNGHHHAHGFQKCMSDAHAAYRAELASGVDGATARMHLHDAQAACRANFPHPRGN